MTPATIEMPHHSESEDDADYAKNAQGTYSLRSRYTDPIPMRNDIIPSDVEANGVIPGSAVYCLAVDLAYDEDDREITHHALVLKELSSRERTYERIGMLFLVDEQMDDLFYGGAVVDITLV
jgi:hypothetical protein